MKKVIGMLVAVVTAAAMVMGCASPSSGGASYFGSKAPNEVKSDWDIVFSDGSATPYTEEMTLTQTQIDNAVGVVFSSDDNVLIAGLPSASGLKWCSNDSNLGKDNKAPLLYGSSYNDGSKGREYLKSDIESLSKEDDTDTDGMYPAWQYCWNYSKGIYSSGWYLPSGTELGNLIKSTNKDKVTAIYKLLEKEITGDAPIFWSSSTSNNGDKAMGYSFNNTNVYDRDIKCIAIPVYSLTSNASAKNTVTIHNYNGATSTKKFMVLDNGKLNMASITRYLNYNTAGDKHLLSVSTDAEGKNTISKNNSITVTADMDLYFHWYYGEELPSSTFKEVGDIVFDDGSFTHCSTASFTDQQKNHADGVIFYTDENNDNGTYYSYAEYDGKKIVLSKKVLPTSNSAGYLGGTRIIYKDIKISALNFYKTSGPSTVTCRGDGKTPNSGLNAYLQGKSSIYLPDNTTLIDEFNNCIYSTSQNTYSLLDGSLAQDISNNQIDIYNGMPAGYYVPSIMELQTIFYYRELIHAQMAKIGKTFQLTVESGGISYWSCNTKPDTDNVYYLEIKSGKTGSYSTTPYEAVKDCQMSSTNRLIYCKKLN